MHTLLLSSCPTCPSAIRRSQHAFYRSLLQETPRTRKGVSAWLPHAAPSRWRWHVRRAGQVCKTCPLPVCQARPLIRALPIPVPTLHQCRPVQIRAEPSPRRSPSPLPTWMRVVNVSAAARIEFLEGERLQRLQCLHTMHSDCLERWLSAAHFGGRCPQCNEPVL